MALPTSADVVIVGAGPAGLATALVLALNHVSFVLLDALAEGHNESRAVVVHSFTLEQLKTVGVAEVIIEAGLPQEEVIGVDDYEQVLTRVQLKKHLGGKTEYPFSVLIAQCEVERLLTVRLCELGAVVYREKRVVGVSEAPGGLNVTLENGRSILAKYVVGADGSKSVVRTAAEIPFLNPTTKQPAAASDKDTQFVLGDIFVQNPLPPSLSTNRVFGGLDRDGIVLLVPLTFAGKPTPPDSHAFRFVASVSPGSAPHAPDMTYLQKLVDDRGPGHTTGNQVKISEVLTSSRYRTRSAVADKYYKRMGESGWVLLAGDAAHIHSPAGGQGMNVGLTDGIQLGQAIIEGTEEAFARYEKKRRHAAIEVIALAEGATNLAMSWWWSVPGLLFIRNLVIRNAMSFSAVSSRAAWRLSGLAYRD